VDLNSIRKVLIANGMGLAINEGRATSITWNASTRSRHNRSARHAPELRLATQISVVAIKSST
jgi:hypothetical protein